MKKLIKSLLMVLLLVLASCSNNSTESDSGDTTTGITGYAIVGTNQSISYNNTSGISLPESSDDFYGQNSNYPGNTPQYQDNGDGTITDLISGLMWQQTSDQDGDAW